LTYNPEIHILHSPKVVNFIDIIAEGDLVVLAAVCPYNDANGNPYTTTWFDMWVVNDGLLTEHWDTARLVAFAPPHQMAMMPAGDLR